jgi:hypothetical protein
MKRKFVALLAIMLGVVGAVAVATPAMAYPSDCTNAAYICWYENSNPAQGWDEQDAPQAIYAKSVCYSKSSSTVIGKTRYIANPTSSSFVVYLNSSCSGTSAPVYAHSTGAMNATWAAKIRSLVRVGP